MAKNTLQLLDDLVTAISGLTDIVEELAGQVKALKAAREAEETYAAEQAEQSETRKY